MKIIEGGVCAAKGFRAGGVYCGIKDNPDKKNDLMVVAADAMCNAAAVYTQNKVKGAPVLVMKKHLKATCGKTMAVVANSKNANTCNADGEEKAEAMCALTAKELKKFWSCLPVLSGRSCPLSRFRTPCRRCAEI